MDRRPGRFWRDERGATSIEYCLIAAFIALAIISVVQQVGVEVRVPFEQTATGLQGRSP